MTEYAIWSSRLCDDAEDQSDRGRSRGLAPRPGGRSGANVVTTDNSDWATNCPEYKVTAVQVSLLAEPAHTEQREVGVPIPVAGA